MIKKFVVKRKNQHDECVKGDDNISDHSVIFHRTVVANLVKRFREVKKERER